MSAARLSTTDCARISGTKRNPRIKRGPLKRIAVSWRRSASRISQCTCEHPVSCTTQSIFLKAISPVGLTTPTLKIVERMDFCKRRRPWRSVACPQAHARPGTGLETRHAASPGAAARGWPSRPPPRLARAKPGARAHGFGPGTRRRAAAAPAVGAVEAKTRTRASKALVVIGSTSRRVPSNWIVLERRRRASLRPPRRARGPAPSCARLAAGTRRTRHLSAH